MSHRRPVARRLPRSPGAALPLVAFLVALSLRAVLYSGFVLGDDIEEWAAARHVLDNGASFEGHLGYRFMVWLPHVVSFALFGVSETAFFLPTLVISSTFAPIAWLMLRRVGLGPYRSLLGALFVGTAPFEVLLGVVHSNDLYLAWFLALGWATVVMLEERGALQGAGIAVALWLAFYTKLFAVFSLPALAAYYLVRRHRKEQRVGLAVFLGASTLLHAATCAFWSLRLGTPFPFFTALSATYPVAPGDLPAVLAQYPAMLLQGSEFGTTLFGLVPYLFLLAAPLTIAAAGRSRAGSVTAATRLEVGLLLYTLTWFLAIEFLPNHFVFDRYYSAPRIFRYLAPLSFPMTLHLSLAALRRLPVGRASRWRHVPVAVVAGATILANVAGSFEATRPGRLHHRAASIVVQKIRSDCPPRVLAEAWIGFFLRDAWLRGSCAALSVVTPRDTHSATDYEGWLDDVEPTLESGSLLLTGLVSYTHYGCHGCGFRTRLFEEPLDPRWVPALDAGVPDPYDLSEPVMLWRWTGEPTPVVPADPSLRSLSSDDLLRRGVDRFEEADYAAAEHHLAVIVEERPAAPEADDALYFLAVGAFRQDRCAETRRLFERLVTAYPESIWKAGALYHGALCHRRLGNVEEARRQLSRLIAEHPDDPQLVPLAAQQLRGLRDDVGLLRRLLWWILDGGGAGGR